MTKRKCRENGDNERGQREEGRAVWENSENIQAKKQQLRNVIWYCYVTVRLRAVVSLVFIVWVARVTSDQSCRVLTPLTSRQEAGWHSGHIQRHPSRIQVLWLTWAHPTPSYTRHCAAASYVYKRRHTWEAVKNGLKWGLRERKGRSYTPIKAVEDIMKSGPWKKALE